MEIHIEWNVLIAMNTSADHTSYLHVRVGEQLQSLLQMNFTEVVGFRLKSLRQEGKDEIQRRGEDAGLKTNMRLDSDISTTRWPLCSPQHTSGE